MPSRVPQRGVSDSAGVPVNYILGVAERWAQLDPATYPSVYNARTQLREHDDREQFLAGIDLILVGIATVNRAGKGGSGR